MKALIVGCMLGAFIGGSVVGWVLTGNAYQAEIARADQEVMTHRAYRQAYRQFKACAEEVTPVRADLIGALGEARRFYGCALDTVRKTEESVTTRAGVAEMAYAPVSKTGPERVAGSTPAPGTNQRKAGR
jgi:hypothetical protein